MLLKTVTIHVCFPVSQDSSLSNVYKVMEEQFSRENRVLVSEGIGRDIIEKFKIVINK